MKDTSNLTSTKLALRDPRIIGPQPGLGRVVSHDHPSRRTKHAMRRLGSTKVRRHWGVPCGILDQGGSSACTGFTSYEWLCAYPFPQAIPGHGPYQLYDENRRHDEWAGEDYEGSSTTGLFEALKALGAIDRWEWGWDANTIADHVLEVAPVCMGTNWHREMFTPDRWGYVWPQGPVDGGHEWLARGVDRARKNPDKTTGAFRGQNSWGPNWGDKGCFWVTFDAMQQLVDDQGEAGIGFERRV